MKVADIKKKVAAKVAKGKAKVAKKCGKCAAVVLALGVIAGCLYPTAPSRSQTLTIRDCDIRIYGGGVETGDVARVEIASQAMAIDTSGTENNTNSPTQTVDTKPDVDVTVGGVGSGSDPVSAVAGAVKSVAGACKSSGTKDCADGSCSTCKDCGD